MKAVPDSKKLSLMQVAEINTQLCENTSDSNPVLQVSMIIITYSTSFLLTFIVFQFHYHDKICSE